MTANEFLDLLRRSQLVTKNQLMQFQGSSLDAELLAEQMVKTGILTEWQSEKLLAGKWKGFLLGKYKLLGHIGKGSMSQVYLGEHTLMKRKVAIRVMPANRVEDSSFVKRFCAEAPGYDVESDGATHYIVMEYEE
jgi:eukaryotic-like serine/threonine-protein kinase